MRDLQALKQIAARNEIEKIESDIICVLSGNIANRYIPCSKIFDKNTGITHYEMREDEIINIEEVTKALDESGYCYTIEGQKLNIAFTTKS